jgi:hypothetical protein
MVKSLLVSFFFLLTFAAKGLAQEENFIAISIYNFTRYIDWPQEDAASDFVIDVIGHKSVYDKLKDLTADRKIGNRRIVVRYLATVNDITKSEILFVGFWQSKEMPKVLAKIGSAHTLITSEKDGLIDAGSGINFVIRNNVIKFEIKRSNIQKYGLKVGEALASLAYKSY